MEPNGEIHPAGNEREAAEGAPPYSLDTLDETALDPDAEEQPLARVRYGLAKELRLFPDRLDVLHIEENIETRYQLENVQRMILSPGDPNPSKLVLMFDLDDGNTVIAAEGMTNVRDFRKLLAIFSEQHPAIELDPPNMDEQLVQALDIRKRSLLGCYGAIAAAIVVIWLVYMAVAILGAHGGH